MMPNRHCYLFVLVMTNLLTAGFSFAAEEEGLIYADGFEDAKRLPELTGIHSLFGVRSATVDLAEGEGLNGSNALRFNVKMQTGHYCYPCFAWSEPVSLVTNPTPSAGAGESKPNETNNGKAETPSPIPPVHVSGYLKFVEQHPEANHLGSRISLCDKNKNIVWSDCHVVPMKDDWIYLYSDAISNLPKAGGFWVRVLDMRPGEEMTFLIDDLRITNYKPIPPPNKETLVRLRRVYEIIRGDWASWSQADDLPDDDSAKEIEKYLRGLERIVTSEDAANPKFTARFAEQVKHLEPLYWECKIKRLLER